MTVDELMLELRPQLEAIERAHAAVRLSVGSGARPRIRLRHVLGNAIIRLGVWIDHDAREAIRSPQTN